MRYSLLLNLNILEALIGDYLHGFKFVTWRCVQESAVMSGDEWLHRLQLPLVHLQWLLQNGSHRKGSPHWASPLRSFDEEVKTCLQRSITIFSTSCLSLPILPTELAYCQWQPFMLSLSYQWFLSTCVGLHLKFNE